MKRLALVLLLVLAACRLPSPPRPGGDGPAPPDPGARPGGPVLFFSDLTDGAVQGWDGSSAKGAAVTVWGLGFGSARGSGYVSIGDVRLARDDDYAEWGASERPQTARGLERITFWLNPGVPLGETRITVTVGGRTSNPLPFHTRREGRIFFVAPDGDDDQPGTLSAPWRSFAKVRTSVRAGDAVYFREGLWTEEDHLSGGSKHAVLELYDFDNPPEFGFADGEPGRSIALASYPGELARIGTGSATDGADRFVMRYDAAGSDGLRYWTFSKFVINTYDYNFAWNASVHDNKDVGLRIVGNDLTSTRNDLTHGHLINVFSNAEGLQILGNYMHDCGRSDGQPGAHKTVPVYFAGGGVSGRVEIGWNEMTRCNKSLQVFGHFTGDRLEHLIVHDNFLHDNKTSTVFGGGDPQRGQSGYAPYTFVQRAEIYNNVFARLEGDFRVDAGSNGLGGDYEVHHNVFFDIAQISMIHVVAPRRFVFHHNLVVTSPEHRVYNYHGSSNAGYPDDPPTRVETGHHNLWYGLPPQKQPGWSRDDLNATDPRFVRWPPRTLLDFRLADGSPAVDLGGPSPRTRDIVGTPAPLGRGHDAGPFEHVPAGR